MLKPTSVTLIPLLTSPANLVTMTKTQRENQTLKSSTLQSTTHSSLWTSLMTIAKMRLLPRASIMETILPDPKKKKFKLAKFLPSILTKFMKRDFKEQPSTTSFTICPKTCHQASHQTMRAIINHSKSKTKLLKNSSHKQSPKLFTSHLFNKFNKLCNNHPSMKSMSLLKSLDVLVVSSLFIKLTLLHSLLSNHKSNLLSRNLPKKLRRKLKTSNSQMEDGNAANAKTITLKVERSVTDAKNQRMMKTAKVCLLT